MTTIPVRNSDTADPFGTADVRERVLQTWRQTPDRFREDANAEEDFARGGYRDRLVVELAQNAADAAADAGMLGRLLVRLTDRELIVANTGTPLTAAGTRSLASLRASAKAGGSGSVGRFGVGFAAVLAVSDEPAVRSTTGSVRFSAYKTRELVAAIPELAAALQARSRHVPVLRLPFVDTSKPPAGYDTAVALPLRSEAAQETATSLVDAIDDAMLLALPTICEVVVERDGRPPRVLRVESTPERVDVWDGDERSRWRVATAGGLLDPALLADRPTEERSRRTWSVTWAIPVDEDDRPVNLPDRVPPVVHAPTPTADPLDLPALLIATFAVDSAREHVRPGPLADFLTSAAAEGYADLVGTLASEQGVSALSLVPAPNLVGEVDGSIREQIRQRLRDRPLLRSAADGAMLGRDRAVVVEDAPADLVRVLSEVIDGLVDVAWTRSPATSALLDPRVISIGDALESVAGLRREPQWWYRLYDALADAPSISLEGLPVPLVDGRVVGDLRGCVVPEGDDTAILEMLGLRVVHPDAAHPLLLRLGARPADPRALLGDARLHAQLAEPQAVDPAEFSRAVLTLVSSAGLQPGAESALQDLLIPIRSGGHARAGDCVLPSSRLAEVVRVEVPVVEPALVDDLGAQSLLAVGALAEFGVDRHHDVLLDPESVEDLVEDGAGWVDHLAALAPDQPGSAIAAELAVVTGLDLVADDAWPAALEMLTEPAVRRAIVEPVRVMLGSGATVSVPSVAAWWLSEAPLFGDLTPSDVRLPGSGDLTGLLPPAPPDAAVLDEELLRAIGVCASVDDLVIRPDGADDALERLAAADFAASDQAVVEVYRALAAVPSELWPDPPARLRVLHPEGTRVIAAESVLVVTAPFQTAVADEGFIVGPPILAEILEVALATEVTADIDFGGGVDRLLPDAVGELYPTAPATYVEHDELSYAGRPVEWWVDDDDRVHASTLEGMARGVAWVTGRWGDRWELLAVLADPSRLADARFERAFDEW